MTRRMLINAQSPEVLRIAIVSGDTLDNYQVEVAERGLTRGNIYRGSIANIEPSLNAAFVDYGAERHGFLAIQDVAPEAWYKQPKGGGRPRIEEVLEKRRPIVVQVTREAEGQKGAVLTTSLSLAGRYLVFTPFEETRGVSRKVEDDDERKRLKAQAAKLQVPNGAGIIVRTNALDQTKAALDRDLAALMRLWKRVSSEARKGKGIKLLYSDQDLILQALRDYLDSSIQEVLVDDDEAYTRAQEYMRSFMPRAKTRLVRYQERAPLFSRHDLEAQIDRIYERAVPLPSGGSLVIDGTEALTAIDVNSGRSTKATSQEETALHTNLEAAREVARQLRLRDIGGLVVVDFIDMRSGKNQRRVEKELREAMKADKARASVGRISSNGLLEVNRQRIQQALSLRTQRPCPTCDGTGRITSPEMVGLGLLRRIEARAANGNLKSVRIALHPELADAFQNSRRREIAALEREFEIRVEVIAASHLHRPQQEIEWYEREVAEGKSKRGRKGKPAQKEEASVRAAHLAVPPEPRRAKRKKDAGTEEEEEEGGEKRSRKRRRRRKGKGGAARSSDEQGGNGKRADERGGERPTHDRGGDAGAAAERVAAEAEDLQRAVADGGGDEGSAEGAKPKRRRRRSRKRGRGKGGGDQGSSPPSPPQEG